LSEPEFGEIERIKKIIPKILKSPKSFKIMVQTNGSIKEIGWKFERWLDLVFMQLIIG
jgi:hypothetical protein